MRILEDLDHPNVIEIYSFYENDPQYFYMVLELMSGGELFDRIVEKVRASFSWDFFFFETVYFKSSNRFRKKSHAKHFNSRSTCTSTVAERYIAALLFHRANSEHVLGFDVPRSRSSCLNNHAVPRL